MVMTAQVFLDAMLHAHWSMAQVSARSTITDGVTVGVSYRLCFRLPFLSSMKV